MTKRIRITKTRKIKRTKTAKRHVHVRPHKRRTVKRRQRGGMFKAVVDSFLNRFQPSHVVYANIDFVRKLRLLLNEINKKTASNKITEIKNLMLENKDQLNNVIWVTNGRRYIIHDPNSRVSSGTPMLLLQILLNVPELKKDRSIYHVFLDNGGDINKKMNPNGLSLKEQLPADFEIFDERTKKRSKITKKTKNVVSAASSNETILQEEVDDEGPIESVIEEPVQVQIEEDIVKSDVGVDLDDIKLDDRTEPTNEQPKTLQVVRGPSYDTTLIFWEPLFNGDELIHLKSKIDNLIASDLKIKHNELCRLCKIVKTIIPSFHVSFENVTNINGLIVFKQPRDIQNANIILCATMLLLGVVAKKLEKQDYTFMFKGGKGVQLAFAYTEKKYAGKIFEDYESEDIDLIIIPNKAKIQYDADIAKTLALNISYLIRWFLNTNYEMNLDSQIMPTNPNVVKFAYKAYMRDDKTPVGNKIALMDIDFSNIPKENQPFYEGKIKMFHKKTPHDGFSEDMLFYFQSLEQQIDEKLYYYLLYTKYKNMLQSRPVIEITDEKYKMLKLNDCKYFLKKFKKSLTALLRGYGEGYLTFFDKYKTDSLFSEALVAEVQAELAK